MNLPTAREAIEHHAFSHARAGDRLYRNDTLIYHRDECSPTGVTLFGVFATKEAEPLLRTLRSTSPLSQTEQR
jgi:hypothetical protein